ncbi:MAG: preprotein translocase subunit SecE [Mollicutes bacterium]|nr:preprotein translocase subunit SecE [Mollicutes bacterium]
MAKVSKKSNKNKAKKESYLSGVKKELKLVKWPTWKEVLKNTLATIILCFLLSGFFLLLNLLLSIIKGWLAS